ncbi:MAG: 4-hydroxythreonine-4-phosphate dehydrogenase, partial [bacterium]|nr:4-hydroxythreonine-4-phosphate dehydrogenase [bacterium]
MKTDRPVIGITMGDPCGVGAEIIIKALSDPEIRKLASFVIFGFSEQLSYTSDRLDADLVFFRDHHENIRKYNHKITVLDYDEFSMPPSMPRGASKIGGAASLAFCEDAISAARRGLIDAMVTAPISKTSWKLAGQHKFPGHTELLAKRCGAKNVAMMFVSPKLKVVLATIHQSLFVIRNSFTVGCVFNPIDFAEQALKDWFGIETPRLGIDGLTPHASEDG